MKRASPCVHAGSALHRRDELLDTGQRLCTSRRTFKADAERERGNATGCVNLKSNSSKTKSQCAEWTKVHSMLVIGPRDLETNGVSVRLNSKGPQGATAKGGGGGD